MGCEAIEEPCTKNKVPFGAPRRKACARGRARRRPCGSSVPCLSFLAFHSDGPHVGLGRAPYLKLFMQESGRSRGGGPAARGEEGAVDTFPKLLMRHARERGAARRSGRRITASGRPGPGGSSRDEVRLLAAGLAAGLPSRRAPRRDRRQPAAALLGDVRGAVLGGVPVPVYQDAVGRGDVFRQNAEIAFAVAENQEQVDKLLEIQRSAPTLAAHLLRRSARPAALRQPELSATRSCCGSAGERSPGARASSMSEVAKGAAATPPSCSTPRARPAVPKGVVLTHDSLIAAPRGREIDGLGETTRCWPTCRWRGSARTSSPTRRRWSSAYCINCPESAETVMTDMREIGPTYYFAPPRVLENLITQVTIRMEDAGVLKRWLFRYFMALARRVGPALLDGRPVGAVDRLLYAAGQPAGLRAAAQHARHEPRARRLYRGRGDRAGALRLLSLARRST